ncbi:phosphoheptose isomerase, partial [mine drainage metagenome]
MIIPMIRFTRDSYQRLQKKEDIVFGISTSGNSPNILKGIEKAKQLGCITVSMSGKKGGKISEIADYKIQANSDRTPII